MDTFQFDTLTRSLSAAGTRRRALAAALAGSLGLLGLVSSDVVSAKSAKKKPCGPCKKREQGKCKAKLPDGTACAGGTCQAGSCIAADPCGSCSGDQVCIGGACVVPACGAGGPCRVFLSSILYDGNLGGLSGADAKCQELAEAAGLPGAYKVWLSDTTSSPASRFVPSTGPYRLVNGTTVARSFADLTDGILLAPINVTETGGGMGGSENSWTHTQSNGSRESTGDHCANWLSNSSANFGDTGHVSSSDAFWTTLAAFPCNPRFHLYCFQQR